MSGRGETTRKNKQKNKIEKKIFKNNITSRSQSKYTMPSVEFLIHDIRFKYFQQLNQEEKKELIKLIILNSITEEKYTELIQYGEENNDIAFKQALINTKHNIEDIRKKLEKEMKINVEYTKDINKVINLYFEQESSEESLNLLRYLIFKNFTTKENFEIWYAWFSSLTMEQKQANIPKVVWNSYTI